MLELLAADSYHPMPFSMICHDCLSSYRLDLDLFCTNNLGPVSRGLWLSNQRVAVTPSHSNRQYADLLQVEC